MNRQLGIRWAAGFLEGEGCFNWRPGSYYTTRDGKRHQKYGRLRLCAEQVEREPLETLQAILGGNLRGPFKTKHQPRYRWDIEGKGAVAVAERLLPYMHSRRRKAIEVSLAKWKARPHQGGDRRSKTWRGEDG